ncbi:hypothetical protein R1sor_022894 [Riccia sorocarpa]|uniref:DNA repair protein RAD16 n=1 Tax=Riccia sorocarpa TaxID=122646 RepID=A0ABD3GL66_9MARC
MSPDPPPAAKSSQGVLGWGNRGRNGQASISGIERPRTRSSMRTSTAVTTYNAGENALEGEEFFDNENGKEKSRKRKNPSSSARGRGRKKTGRSRGDDIPSDSSSDDSSDDSWMVNFAEMSKDESSDDKSRTSDDSDGSSLDGLGRKRRRLPEPRGQPRMRGGRGGRGGGRGRGEPKKRVSVKKGGPKETLQWERFIEDYNRSRIGLDEYDFEVLPKQSNPPAQMDPPAELCMPLLPFQREWLAWSLNQEKSEIRGGILADEMGMGKTIQAISLIVTDRHLYGPVNSSRVTAMKVPAFPEGPIEEAQNSVELPLVKATLVICPLVAVIQWRCEIEKFTAPGSVKVLIYHGPKRGLGVAELSQYDVVLSTYAIVESEHRKHVMPPKVHCRWCRKLFYPAKLAIHLRYFCGPSAQRTDKQSKQVKRKTTTASTACDSDIDDDICKGKGKKSGVPAARRRGPKFKVAPDDLGAAVQGAMDSLAGASSSGTVVGNSVLHSVQWARIVLDEAHSIKDRRCSTAKAIFALKSTFKWALSGTPLQNRVGELYSLVRFLGVDPYSYYFCRKCDCKSLDYKFNEGHKCECGHSSLLHFCWWNKFIANPIKRWGYVDDGRTAMNLLKDLVLNKTLLRRTKLERAADLALPPRTTYLRRDVFDAREEDFYQALYTQSQSQFNTYVDAGTLLNNYAHIFDLLTRLRQAVNHPYLVVYSATANSEAPQYDAPVQEAICGICHEPAEDIVKTGCQHSFCKVCMQEYMEAGKGLESLQCPSCQTALMVDLTRSGTEAVKEVAVKVPGRKRSSILNRIKLENFQSSTKIDAVREEIFDMLDKDPAAKAIIFSQFTAMLELIGHCLQKSGIRLVKLDGSMSMQARDQMINTFTNDVETKVFLMSLKAGGVALNLTVASHVFLMDPWWNPAVEQQAQDRIHRLGQYKPVRVIRFVIENTIEERILKLQEKKQLVFEGTVGGSAEALGKLTEDDLRFLFTN